MLERFKRAYVEKLMLHSVCLSIIYTITLDCKLKTKGHRRLVFKYMNRYLKSLTNKVHQQTRKVVGPEAKWQGQQYFITSANCNIILDFLWIPPLLISLCHSSYNRPFDIIYRKQFIYHFSQCSIVTLGAYWSDIPLWLNAIRWAWQLIYNSRARVLLSAVLLL